MSENGIVKKESAEIVNWEAEMAKDARDEAARVVVSAPSISVQGGILQIAGQAIAENKLVATILDHVFIKQFFDRPYDPEDKDPPDCWTIGSTMRECETPDERATFPQFDNCAKCPKNQFKSKGKGKACRDTIRMMVIPADDCVSPERVSEAQPYKLAISPTGLKGYGLYLNSIKDNYNRPPYGMITEIGVVRVKTYFHLTFKPVSPLDMNIIGAIRTKKESIQDMLWQGWDPKAADAPKAEPTQHSQKF